MQLSDFYFKLEPKIKKRYLEKISCIGNIDPYFLKANDFSQDVKILPALRYVASISCVYIPIIIIVV